MPDRIFSNSVHQNFGPHMCLDFGPPKFRIIKFFDFGPRKFRSTRVSRFRSTISFSRFPPKKSILISISISKNCVNFCQRLSQSVTYFGLPRNVEWSWKSGAGEAERSAVGEGEGGRRRGPLFFNVRANGREKERERYVFARETEAGWEEEIIWVHKDFNFWSLDDALERSLSKMWHEFSTVLSDH